MMLRKKCTKCEIVKPLEEYYLNKEHRDGHYNECKECTKKRVRKYQRENRAKITKRARKYNQAHREQMNKSFRKYKQKMPRDFRCFYQKIHRWARETINQDYCTICNDSPSILETANISGQYLKDISDWMILCISCHKLFDKLNKTHKKLSRRNNKEVKNA